MTVNRLSYIGLTVVLLALWVPVSAATLPVPFTSQAPRGAWTQPWQDACEEATIVMIDAYYAGQMLSVDSSEKRLLNVFNIKNAKFGSSLDENAQKISDIINAYYPWEAYVVDSPSLDQIKREIDTGHPVIVPVYGRALYNPHFRASGPVYHTVVISGYDDTSQTFIAQEPGTRYGLDYHYSYDTIMNAMHDYVPGDTANGSPRAIFTRRELLDTASSDADEDGLTKQQEIDFGTILWLADSDGDGFTDGYEVANGYLPTINEQRLPVGSVIKSPSDPKVYSLSIGGVKRHIINEAVFLSHGWTWSAVRVLSGAFIRSLSDGAQITQ
ncbi:MAG: hypothetical protein COU35_02890 [Candidatus Magasanikbacteria bacterium CG10_big_fil_rev_8_21_14_0_10_47_10]|uniref:Peptidase C39-like domain-containing protein n=1 Tax=Candidatus Magasanikbacteria bacterium CG10_big_fil_rev_8_21_14_0_10_47_10 TaxID=1974652 RepID=A0A2H0TQC9_9BACT|nr:MAG: hypothetical protein COU35_02890 [Candidatus Magasanikbacteria bacterium CG10_big_fil_rev_8_21_14_0_10_47_10]